MRSMKINCNGEAGSLINSGDPRRPATTRMHARMGIYLIYGIKWRINNVNITVESIYSYIYFVENIKLLSRVFIELESTKLSTPRMHFTLKTFFICAIKL